MPRTRRRPVGHHPAAPVAEVDLFVGRLRRLGAGHNPALRFICVSYSNELSEELARQFRLVVESDWYLRLFPAMKHARATATDYVTPKGGGRLATSVGGTLTGRGADIIIIDDPLKASDAQSEVARRRVNSWFAETLSTRLNDK